jgi:hypothetical protein
MSTDVRTLQNLLQPQEMTEKNLIDSITADYMSMKSARSKWESEREELMNFIAATDTRTTTNSKLPFKNSTTINKLAQIRNNLVTAYMEHLIPNSQWVQWQATSEDDDTQKKRTIIENYVRNKIETSGAEAVIERLVDDFILSGIAVSFTRHVRRTQKAPGGIENNIYTGSEVVRVDPLDFVFDVTASSLDTARKCIRSVYTLGALRKHVGEASDAIMSESDFQALRDSRMQIQKALADGTAGKRKHDTMVKNGFGDQINYIENNTVEVLHFYGDFYDFEKDELLENYEIVVVDRRFVTKKEPIDNWLGNKNLHVSVWEFRDDSLSPIGPMARIVGMQYKLDKLENLKADIYDKFADPATVEIGDVRKHGVQGAPGFRYEVDEGGDVKYLLPPPQVLQFENQIPVIMQLMEDLSGEPKEGIGQRTPGEKTKFEVQLLDRGQSKLFRRKVKKFERELLTNILQDYLIQGRFNLDASDVVRVADDELGVELFTQITADDLQGSGQVIAKGATIFAERANALQNINAILSGGAAGMLAPHTSRKKLARAIEELADLTEYGLFTPNIGIQEDAESQRLAQSVQDTNVAASGTDGNVTDEAI